MIRVSGWANAIDATTLWPGIKVKRISNVISDTRQFIFQGDEYFTNLQTGESTTVPVMVGEKILVGTSLLYYDANTTNTNFLYLPDIRHPLAGIQMITPDDSGVTVNSYSFNGQYAGWHTLTSHANPALYDVQKRQVINFPLQYHPLNYTFIAARYIVWEEDADTDAQVNAILSQHREAPIYYGIVDMSTLSSS